MKPTENEINKQKTLLWFQGLTVVYNFMQKHASHDNQPADVDSFFSKPLKSSKTNPRFQIFDSRENKKVNTCLLTIHNWLITQKVERKKKISILLFSLHNQQRLFKTADEQCMQTSVFSHLTKKNTRLWEKKGFRDAWKENKITVFPVRKRATN